MYCLKDRQPLNSIQLVLDILQTFKINLTFTHDIFQPLGHRFVAGADLNANIHNGLTNSRGRALNDILYSLNLQSNLAHWPSGSSKILHILHLFVTAGIRNMFHWPLLRPFDHSPKHYSIPITESPKRVAYPRRNQRVNIPIKPLVKHIHLNVSLKTSNDLNEALNSFIDKSAHGACTTKKANTPSPTPIPHYIYRRHRWRKLILTSDRIVFNKLTQLLEEQLKSENYDMYIESLGTYIIPTYSISSEAWRW